MCKESYQMVAGRRIWWSEGNWSSAFRRAFEGWEWKWDREDSGAGEKRCSWVWNCLSIIQREGHQVEDMEDRGIEYRDKKWINQIFSMGKKWNYKVAVDSVLMYLLTPCFIDNTFKVNNIDGMSHFFLDHSQIWGSFMERELGLGSSKLGTLSSSVLVCNFGQVPLSFHISKTGHNISSLHSIFLHCCGKTKTR